MLALTQDESKRYYVFIDDIHLSFKVKNEDVDENLIPDEDKDMLYTTFYDILNDLMARSALYLYNWLQFKDAFKGHRHEFP